MKQILIKHGKAVVEEVPAPESAAGCVLVEVQFSCISVGTEMSGIRMSGLPLWKRALQHPEEIGKVARIVAKQGITRTWSLITGSLNAGAPSGYSAAGVVTAVGSGIDDIEVGDLVACAGAQYAFHAEIICVPRNLVVPVPDGVTAEHASTVTLGAIALQGVRRASPTLGETFVVTGLGILGQLCSQILTANGCKVIGVDPDAKRLQLALELGMNAAVDPADKAAPDQVARLTNGLGADGVIICASSPSDDVLSTAFKMCRKKGRVVLIGDVGMQIRREDIFKKELDFFISTSYGPGRYDRQYEEKGVDYPAGYVRWTENRNMGEILRLIADGRIKLDRLIQQIKPLDEAPAVYENLNSGIDKPLMALLSYPAGTAGDKTRNFVINPSARACGSDGIRIAVAGAGSFAKSMHLPNLAGMRGKFEIKAIMSKSGHNAEAVARQFGAAYSTTSYQKILDDKEVDAILICARHNLHADMTLQALKAGKHVLVEKPLALNRTEMEPVRAFYSDAGQTAGPALLTGFNRRFSPFAAELAGVISKRSGPMIINYRMNVDHVEADDWTMSAEGGGRNIGEACHIYDFFTFLTQSKVTGTAVNCIKPATGFYSKHDNFVATFQFEDGSVASLTYTSMGIDSYPKESCDIFFDGKVGTYSDFTYLSIEGTRRLPMIHRVPDKGHEAELKAFWKCVRNGGEWPIPLWQQLQAMEMAFQVEDHLGAS